MVYIFVICSSFYCSAASRKGGTGNELVGMVKDGTLCGVNKVTTYLLKVLLTKLKNRTKSENQYYQYPLYISAVPCLIAYAIQSCLKQSYTVLTHLF